LQIVLKKFLESKDVHYVYPNTSAPDPVSQPASTPWIPAENSRVQRGPHWRWSDQDNKACGVVLAIQEPWAHVRWDNGSFNWYLISSQPDLMECTAKELKPPARVSQTPIEWIELVMNDVFTRQFDKDFENFALHDDAMAQTGDRVFAWLESMSRPLEALQLAHSTLHTILCAKLLVHACLTRGLMKSSAFFSSGSPALYRMLLTIGDALSNQNFRAFFKSSILKFAASNSVLQDIFAGVWCAAFTAVDQDNKADADILCRLLGVFLESEFAPHRVHYGSIFDDGEEVQKREGLCLFCNLPWLSHNVHECRVGWNKGSSSEWLKEAGSSMDPSISASASFIDRISTSRHSSSRSSLMTQYISECCTLNDENFGEIVAQSNDARSPWIRLF
jgi:hypothetical protein